MTAKPISASIRRLYAIAARVGDDAPAKVARRMNVSAQTLNNWEARGISQSGALSAQDVYGCDAVWLTTGKGAQVPGVRDTQPTYNAQSQPMKLDPEIVRKVGAALNLRYKSAGGYSLEDRPEEFVRAYELWFGMDDAYEDPEVYNLVIRHADLSPQGASENDRNSEGAPTHGAPGEGVRAGRRR